MICSPVCVYMLGKVYWVNVSIASRSKEDKKLTLLTYMCIRVCIYMIDRKYRLFVFISPHVRFLIFGDYVSHPSSQQKKVACFFALSLVLVAFCCPSWPLVVECLLVVECPQLIKFFVIYTFGSLKWIKNSILLDFIAGPKIQARRHFLTNQIRIFTYLF